jgi:hypothetical protein
MSTQPFNADTYYALLRIDQILGMNALGQNHPLLESAFIETVIRLNQLNISANEIGKRISFKDDLRIFPGVGDITSAVKEYRNAVCHISHEAHFIAPDGTPKGPRLKKGVAYSQISFSVIFGKRVMMKTPQYTIESEYDDDVCFIFGAHRLYLRRHIVRNFQEAKAILMPSYPNPY